MAKDSKEPAENGAKETPSRFQEIVTERHMFNAEKCFAQMPAGKRLPLVGYLVNVEDMPPIRNREWQAYVIKTTEPTHALNREKEVVEVPVGSLVLIPATYQLFSFLSKAAVAKTYVFEVAIQPNKKVSVGGGQTMWTYKLGANPKPIPRASFGVTAILTAEKRALAALPPAETPDFSADDVPPFG